MEYMKTNKIVIGNWKMNKSVRESAACAKELLDARYDLTSVKGTDIVLTPSFLALNEVKKVCAGRNGI